MAGILLKIDPSGNVTELRPGSHLLGRLIVLSASQYSLHRQRLRRTDKLGQKAAEQKICHDQNYTDHILLTQASTQATYGTPSLIWVWPRSPSDKPDYRNVAALPEPLCHEPMTNGVRVVRGLEGYFGEVWRNTLLISIRWWAEQPTRRQWEEFIRATGLQTWTEEDGADHVLNPPDAIDVPFRKNLVFGGSDWAGRVRQFRAETLLVPVIAVTALAIAFDVGQVTGLQSKIQERQALLKLQEESAATWLPFRRDALQARDDISRLMDRRESIALVYALTDLSYALKGRSVTIRGVDLVDDRLAVTFDKPGLAEPVSVIEALERSVTWQTVSYDNNRQQIIGQLSTRLPDQGDPLPGTVNDE